MHIRHLHNCRAGPIHVFYGVSIGCSHLFILLQVMIRDTFRKCESMYMYIRYRILLNTTRSYIINNFVVCCIRVFSINLSVGFMNRVTHLMLYCPFSLSLQVKKQLNLTILMVWNNILYKIKHRRRLIILACY